MRNLRWAAAASGLLFAASAAASGSEALTPGFRFQVQFAGTPAAAPALRLGHANEPADEVALQPAPVPVLPSNGALAVADESSSTGWIVLGVLAVGVAVVIIAGSHHGGGGGY